MNDYIENDFNDIKDYTKEYYKKVRNLNSTNSDKFIYKDLLNNNQLNYLYKKFDKYMEEYNFSDKLKNDILFEL